MAPLEVPPARAPSLPGAVVVLVGGESRRLGRPKAWIDWDGEPLLARILRRLGPLAPGETVVAARPDQPLPETGARRVDDLREGAGPLAGLAVALEDVAGRLGPDVAVAVSACDHPFADPGLFRALGRLLEDADLAMPRHAGRLHVLQGIWRARLGIECERALADGERRVRTVVDGARARIVEPDELPEGLDLQRALLNVNDSVDLARARDLGGDPNRRPPRTDPRRGSPASD